MMAENQSSEIFASPRECNSINYQLVCLPLINRSLRHYSLSLSLSLRFAVSILALHSRYIFYISDCGGGEKRRFVKRGNDVSMIDPFNKCEKEEEIARKHIGIGNS